MKDLMGKTVRDKITGYEGIATSYHRYITGCSQYGLQSKVDKDGKIPEIKYFDESRLEVVEGTATLTLEETQENPGCDYREHP